MVQEEETVHDRWEGGAAEGGQGQIGHHPWHSGGEGEWGGAGGAGAGADVPEAVQGQHRATVLEDALRLCLADILHPGAMIADSILTYIRDA